MIDVFIKENDYDGMETSVMIWGAGGLLLCII